MDNQTVKKDSFGRRVLNKLITFLTYCLAFVVLVLVHFVAIDYMTTGKINFISDFSLYYSLCFVDLYLLVLYYLNYSYISSLMIRRKLFLPYIFILLISMILGLLLPLIGYWSMGWKMVGFEEEPVSMIGVVGAVAVFSISLSIRAVKEWVRLEELKRHSKDDIKSQKGLQEENEALREQNEALTKEKAELEAKLKETSAVEAVIEA